MSLRSQLEWDHPLGLSKDRAKARKVGGGAPGGGNQAGGGGEGRVGDALVPFTPREAQRSILQRLYCIAEV